MLKGDLEWHLHGAALSFWNGFGAPRIGSDRRARPGPRRMAGATGTNFSARNRTILNAAAATLTEINRAGASAPSGSRRSSSAAASIPKYSRAGPPGPPPSPRSAPAARRDRAAHASAPATTGGPRAPSDRWRRRSARRPRRARRRRCSARRRSSKTCAPAQSAGAVSALTRTAARAQSSSNAERSMTSAQRLALRQIARRSRPGRSAHRGSRAARLAIVAVGASAIARRRRR